MNTLKLPWSNTAPIHRWVRQTCTSIPPLTTFSEEKINKLQTLHSADAAPDVYWTRLRFTGLHKIAVNPKGTKQICAHKVGNGQNFALGRNEVHSTKPEVHNALLHGSWPFSIH